MVEAGKITDLSFCPILDEMVSTGRTIDRDGKIVMSRGRSTANNLMVLCNLHRELKPTATLEVGLAYGASALAFAQGHKDIGAAPELQHVAIDPFQHHLNDAGLVVIDRAGLSGYVQHIIAFSDRALPALLEERRRFGMIYIDGSHLFEDVFVDCHYAAQLLDEGGVMVLDDSSDEHVAKAIRFVRRNMGHMLTELDVSPYRADGGRPVRYRAAKALGRTQLTAFRKTGSDRRGYDAKLASF